jgi:hypothetical protein
MGNSIAATFTWKLLFLQGAMVITDSVSRFWDKYINKTVSYGVPERARRYYVRHVEMFIKANSNTRLSAMTERDITQYFEMIGRKRDIVGWQQNHGPPLIYDQTSALVVVPA